jgi:hypothetical protein
MGPMVDLDPLVAGFVLVAALVFGLGLAANYCHGISSRSPPSPKFSSSHVQE